MKYFHIRKKVKQSSKLTVYEKMGVTDWVFSFDENNGQVIQSFFEKKSKGKFYRISKGGYFSWCEDSKIKNGILYHNDDISDVLVIIKIYDEKEFLENFFDLLLK